MENKTKPKPIVVAGPSGVGKSTLIGRLLKDYPNEFGFSISHTTRKIRDGEINGINYHFVSKEEFDKDAQDGKFVEHVTYAKNHYGTSIQSVKAILNEGKFCLLDIETQGVSIIKEKGLDIAYLFIKPVSIQQLRERLMKRGTETVQVVDGRIEIAKREIELADNSTLFDRIIINDNLEQAYIDLLIFLKMFNSNVHV